MVPYKLFSRMTRSKYLFHFLLRKLEPDLVLDIGSRDGRDSLDFRKASPGSDIIAFEANPQLAERMRNDPELARNRIRVEHCAVGAADGTAPFFVFNEARGTGSLLPRTGAGQTGQEFAVPVRRIDDVEPVKGHRRIALWIDVEGCGYDALQGARGILGSTIVVHIEVESEAYWSEQRLVSDIVGFLDEQGFVPVYERYKRGKAQGNMIFLKRETAGRFGMVKDILLFDLSQGIRKLLRLQNGRR